MSGKLLHLIATILCAATLLVGCGTGELHPRLNAARQLVETDPESCLTILSTIDTTKLRSDRDRAYSRLLELRATDKTHRPLSHLLPQADYAVEYFDNHDADTLRMLAHYCRGRVLFANEQYTRTIVDLAEAMDIATARSDWFWMGMCARSISDVFNETFNSSEELHWSKKALEYFGKSGRTEYRNYALLDLALAYNQDCNYAEAIKIVPELFQIADDTDDDNLRYEALMNFGISLIGIEDYHAADSILELASRSPYSNLNDTTLWAMAMVNDSNFNEMPKVLNTIQNLDDRRSLYTMAKYLKHKGQLAESVSVHERLDSMVNVDIHNTMNQFVTGALMQYYDNCLYTQNLEKNNLKIRAIGFIIFCLLIIVILVAVSIHLYLRNKQEIERNYNLAQNLSEKPILLSNVSPDNNKALKAIASRFKHLNSVFQTIYECNSIDNALKRISKEVKSLIDEFSRNDSIPEDLINEINLNCNNICTRLKKSCPSLSVQEYKLFIFSVAGFSNAAIAILTGIKDTANVSRSKYRLKTKINKLNPPDKDEFINAMDLRSRKNT